MKWKNDKEMFQLMKEKLYTPVVGDILDTMGYYHQFLPQSVRPLRDDMRLAGRAMPVLIAEVYGVQKKPFGLLTEALDQLQEDEIYISTGGSFRAACWGELLTVTSRMRKAAGAVLYGYHRDTPQILEQNWPVFSTGCYAQDSGVRTAVAAFRCDIEVVDVKVAPGDIIFGDIDGVLVVPSNVADEVIEKAVEKVAGEKKVRQAIEKGMSSTEAFKTFGIL